MPADYCSRLHNVQDIRPAGPEATQDHPEQAVRICQVRPGDSEISALPAAAAEPDFQVPAHCAYEYSIEVFQG